MNSSDLTPNDYVECTLTVDFFRLLNNFTTVELKSTIENFFASLAPFFLRFIRFVKVVAKVKSIWFLPENFSHDFSTQHFNFFDLKSSFPFTSLTHFHSFFGLCRINDQMITHDKIFLVDLFSHQPMLFGPNAKIIQTREFIFISFLICDSFLYIWFRNEIFEFIYAKMHWKI